MNNNIDNIEEAFMIDTVSIRLVKDAPLIGGERLDSPEKVVKRFAEMLSEYDREVVGVINFKTDLTPINIHIASIGAINTSVVKPRDIMKAAILSNASGIMLIHNHPSGNIAPSSNDLEVTEKMDSACNIMGISLLDHIIVGGENINYFSFHENKIMPLNNINIKKNIS